MSNISNSDSQDNSVLSPHLCVNPSDMAKARGFSHAVIAQPGKTIYLAGQIAVDANSKVVGNNFAEQFSASLSNVVQALRAAGGSPEHLVSLVMYATDVDAYRSSLREIGAAYRAIIGSYYPAMTLVGVTELVEPLAMIEIVGTAVIPNS